ncbi:peptidyl-prolyl cis-trans isomerase [bacterium]|nr:peptidyl-prolyl cis-trans isomerase [bacterium]
MKRRVVWCLAIVVIACSEAKPDYIVKVGETLLTETMIDSALRNDVRGQTNARDLYIQQWIQTETLYQKAKMVGMDKDPRYLQQMALIQKELLVQAFVEGELDKSIQITKQEIEQFYQEHSKEFEIPEDQVKTEYFFTREKLKAKNLEQQLIRMARIRVKDFVDLVTQAASDSDIIGATEFLPRDKFEEKIAKYLFAKNATDEIIGPIQNKNGYYTLWHVEEIRPKGAPKPLAQVEGEIEARLKAIKRKRKTEELVKKIKNEIPIEYNTPLTP